MTVLLDKHTYTKVTDKRRNPTSRVEKDLENLLSEIKSCPSTHDPNAKQGAAKMYYRLHGRDATSAAF